MDKFYKFIVILMAKLFLVTCRYGLICGIYFYFKKEITFYDILIIIAFSTVWSIEASLNAIELKTEGDR
jgi:hypothetical protein